MIFVTVGTHEQQFNRLVKYIDDLLKDGKIKEEVIIQKGYSDYIPKYAKYYNFLDYDEIQELYKKSKIIITHGGPSSFIPAIQLGKVPLVVPRNNEFNEHVNNHQIRFCRLVNSKYNNIVIIEDIDDLYQYIINYDDLVTKNINFISNNKNFIDKFKKLIDDI